MKDLLTTHKTKIQTKKQKKERKEGRIKIWPASASNIYT